MPDIYRDNPNLKRANVQIQFTKEQVQEYQKCMEDPVYFTESYVKIIKRPPSSPLAKAWIAHELESKAR